MLLPGPLTCPPACTCLHQDHLASTPQQLGDPRRDSQQEMEERHDRVVAAAHLALAALLQLAAAPLPAAEGKLAGNMLRTTSLNACLCKPCLMWSSPGSHAVHCLEQEAVASASSMSSPPPPLPAAGPSARDAQVAAQQQELLQQLSSIIASPTFYKRSLGAKSAAVRQAAYVAISRMCQAAPAALDASLAEASSAVLGALHEKEAVNHGAMWEMVLGFIKVGSEGQGAGGQACSIPCNPTQRSQHFRQLGPEV